MISEFFEVFKTNNVFKLEEDKIHVIGIVGEREFLLGSYDDYDIADAWMNVWEIFYPELDVMSTK